MHRHDGGRQRGTSPEHHIDVVIAADALRRLALGSSAARFKRWTRTWLEPWFNLLGILFGFTTLLIPPSSRRRFYLWLCPKLGGHAPEHNPELEARTLQTVKLAKDLYAKTGRWPALFVLTSHAETEGPLQWLRFELLRQGLIVANAVTDENPNPGWFTHPSCLLAIDPFALDTLPVPVAGFYAGWMHSVYLAWDRQPSTQSFIQRQLLLRRSTYETIAWRMLERLRQGSPVLMVLSGGLPHNARLLYGAREFIQALKLPKWPVSKREAETRLMKILMTPVEGARAAEKGDIPPGTSQSILNLFGELGINGEERQAHLQNLVQLFKPAVPVRERLMRVLDARIVRKGQPLIILPVAHRDHVPHVKIGEPTSMATSKSLQEFFNHD